MLATVTLLVVGSTEIILRYFNTNENNFPKIFQTSLLLIVSDILYSP